MLKSNNSLQAHKPMPMSTFLTSDAVKLKVNSILSDPKKGARFISTLISSVNQNKELAVCEPGSLVNAALLGESLNLSPSPQLGQFYLVPFNNKDGKTATFQLGYKGYIQLAMRSGEYKKLNVVDVKDGELVKFDRFNEEIIVNQIDDEEERENAETIGYYAMFEYTNGFRKAIYWSKKKMERHALKYSRGYQAKKGYTFWEKDFDGMAFKTMLRQLISKWGIMSTEIIKAFEADMGVVKDNGDIEYVDNAPIEQETKQVEVVEEATGEIINQEANDKDPDLFGSFTRFE